jgi:ABC-2 type transport system ATP-binding protein
MVEADRLAEQLAVVDHGHVIAEGTPEELKERLGAYTIDLGFVDHETATNAAISLGQHPDVAVGDDDMHVDDTTLELSVDDGPRTAVVVLRILDGEGMCPTSLAVREPSLDDVFLTLTGHRAEEDDEVDASADGHKRERGAA